MKELSGCLVSVDMDVIEHMIMTIGVSDCARLQIAQRIKQEMRRLPTRAEIDLVFGLQHRAGTQHQCKETTHDVEFCQMWLDQRSERRSLEITNRWTRTLKVFQEDQDKMLASLDRQRVESEKRFQDLQHRHRRLMDDMEEQEEENERTQKQIKQSKKEWEAKQRIFEQSKDHKVVQAAHFALMVELRAKGKVLSPFSNFFFAIYALGSGIRMEQCAGNA